MFYGPLKVIVVIGTNKIAESLEAAIERARNQSGRRERKGCIITGDRDHGYEKALELAGELEEHGFPCKLFVEKGMGHLIPENFPLLLQQAVEFVIP